MPGERLKVRAALEHLWVTDGMTQELRTLNDSLLKVI